MTVQCPSCKAILTEQDKFCSYCRTPLTKPTESHNLAADNATNETGVDVVMKSAGTKKIAVIKVVRDLTSLGLKEAKDLVDTAPQIVVRNVDKDTGQMYKDRLEREGAFVELRDSGKVPVATFTDADRDSFLRDRGAANSSGCMIFILFPIAASCLWWLLS